MIRLWQTHANCSWISLRKTPMFKKYKNLSDSRLKVVEQLDGSVMSLTNKAKLSLYKKSLNSGIGADILEEVYTRGYSAWDESFDGTPEQFAFDRVNSFISGGFATTLDEDLMEKRGLWDNIWAKRKRIEKGSGEHMRKAGSEGAPTEKALKNSQSEEYIGAEKPSKDIKNPSNRFVGSDELVDNYKKTTPSQSAKEVIKQIVRENWQNSKYKNPEGGLTKAGVMAYRHEHPGSKLKTAVTKKPSELKAGSKDANRRKSFCARMKGMKSKLTSSETAHDPDSRINKSLRKWHCEEVEINEKSGKINVNQRAKDIIDNHLTPNGWKLKRQKGIHDIYHHPDYKEQIALPRHKGDLAPGTVRSIVNTVNSPPTIKRDTNTKSTVKNVMKEKLDEINIRDAAGKIEHIKNVKIRMADGTIKSLPLGKSGSSGGGGR